MYTHSLHLTIFLSTIHTFFFFNTHLLTMNSYAFSLLLATAACVSLSQAFIPLKLLGRMSMPVLMQHSLLRAARIGKLQEVGKSISHTLSPLVSLSPTVTRHTFTHPLLSQFRTHRTTAHSYSLESSSVSCVPICHSSTSHHSRSTCDL